MADPERFTWRGINFVWKREQWPHFAGSSDGIYAKVSPHGMAWSATIRIGGGEGSHVNGSTPAEALDGAHAWWKQQVERLK